MATSQPPQASLIGIPPELKNMIYHFVADDIEEASIIGRKLESKNATRNAETRVWDAIARHPLSQTCQQLRLEFDPIHQCRVLSTGVEAYWLDIENFDMDQMTALAKLLPHVPQLFAHLRTNQRFTARLNIGKSALKSAEALEQRGNSSASTMKGDYERLMDVIGMHGWYNPLTVQIHFRTRTMSRAEKEAGVTGQTLNAVISRLKSMLEAPERMYGQDWGRLDKAVYKDQVFIRGILRKLQHEKCIHYREQRWEREEKINSMREETVKAKTRVESRSELKIELREALAAQPESAKWDVISKFLEEA